MGEKKWVVYKGTVGVHGLGQWSVRMLGRIIIRILCHIICRCPRHASSKLALLGNLEEAHNE